MNIRDDFQKLVRKTLETAINQNHKIDVKEVRDIFSEIELEESKFKQIYDYLIENKIKVIGYINLPGTENGAEKEEIYGHKPKSINAKDTRYLALYYEELEEIPEGTEEEEIQLFQEIKKGNRDAKGRFTELNLRKIAGIAQEYKNLGMTLEDLIQEGNIAFMQSLEELLHQESLDSARKFIDSYVRKWIYDALREQQKNDDFEYKVVEKSNSIYEALIELEEILGERADVGQLADYMKITPEEILETLELSKDVLELENDHDHAE